MSHYLDKVSFKCIILLPPFSLCCEFLEPTVTKKRLRKYNTVLGSQKSPEYHQRLQFTSYSVSPIAHVSKCIQYEQQDIGKSTFCWLPRGAFYPGHVASTTAFSWGSYCFYNCLAFFVLITSTVLHLVGWPEICLMFSSWFVHLRLWVSGRWKVTHPTFASNKCVVLFIIVMVWVPVCIWSGQSQTYFPFINWASHMSFYRLWIYCVSK